MLGEKVKYSQSSTKDISIGDHEVTFIPVFLLKPMDIMSMS